MLIDVKKAFLYGMIKRRVYIELPAEDPRAKEGNLVGRLLKTMYGTRDAPQVWQEEVQTAMKEIGYEASLSTRAFTTIGQPTSRSSFTWTISCASGQRMNFSSST